MKRRGEIYIVTNDINDKVYIGKTYAGYLRRFSIRQMHLEQMRMDGTFLQLSFI